MGQFDPPLLDPDFFCKNADGKKKSASYIPLPSLTLVTNQSSWTFRHSRLYPEFHCIIRNVNQTSHVRQHHSSEQFQRRVISESISFSPELCSSFPHPRRHISESASMSWSQPIIRREIKALRTRGPSERASAALFSTQPHAAKSEHVKHTHPRRHTYPSPHRGQLGGKANCG